ncbi:hypothetical protein D9M68_991660 [compost metagenome]
MPLGTGMGAAGRNGQRQAAECEDFEIRAGRSADDLSHGRQRQFRPQAYPRGAAAGQHAGGGAVIDIDEGADEMRPPREEAQR